MKNKLFNNIIDSLNLNYLVNLFYLFDISRIPTFYLCGLLLGTGLFILGTTGLILIVYFILIERPFPENDILNFLVNLCSSGISPDMSFGVCIVILCACIVMFEENSAIRSYLRPSPIVILPNASDFLNSVPLEQHAKFFWQYIDRSGFLIDMHGNVMGTMKESMVNGQLYQIYKGDVICHGYGKFILDNLQACGGYVPDKAVNDVITAQLESGIRSRPRAASAAKPESPINTDQRLEYPDARPINSGANTSNSVVNNPSNIGANNPSNIGGNNPSNSGGNSGHGFSWEDINWKYVAIFVVVVVIAVGGTYAYLHHKNKKAEKKDTSEVVNKPKDTNEEKSDSDSSSSD